MQLDDTLKQRREHKKKSKYVRERQARQAHAPAAPAAGDGGDVSNDDESGDDAAPEEDAGEGAAAPGKMSVEEFLGGGFEDTMESDSGEEDDMMEDIEDVSDTEGAHLQDLEKLKEKDPEFYKYLQENDRELLDFDPDRVEEDVDLENVEDARLPEQKAPVLTKEILRRWQKALLEVRPQI